eukprot:2053418-Pleurochrysis_carterae.AAC.3
MLLPKRACSTVCPTPANKIKPRSYPVAQDVELKPQASVVERVRDTEDGDARHEGVGDEGSARCAIDAGTVAHNADAAPRIHAKLLQHDRRERRGQLNAPQVLLGGDETHEPSVDLRKSIRAPTSGHAQCFTQARRTIKNER